MAQAGAQDGPQGRLTEAQREQIKLRATFLNNIGIGILLVGAFTPTIRLLYGDLNPKTDNLWLVGSAVGCFLAGFALHFSATLLLRRLSR